MNKVAIEICNDYDIENVRSSVRQAVDNLGGIKTFVSPGDRVLLKPNLLMRRKPEKATTTHPAVVQALAELVVESGGKPIIGDSPGEQQAFTESILDSIYDTCGMKEAASNGGAELNYNTDAVDMEYPYGEKVKSLKVIKVFTEVDKVINIPKLKTHMLTVCSGGVKNLFGIVPGKHKSDFHYRFKSINDFSDLLVDICLFAKPALTVMDAVVAMEGYGPTAGRPKKMGLIIAGKSPFNVDIVASNLIGLKARHIPTIRKAAERALCSFELKDIEITGEVIDNVKITDFKIPTFRLTQYYMSLPGFLMKWADWITRPKIFFDYTCCISCRACAKSCPASSIEMISGKPVFSQNKCIKCYCCLEICDKEAIHIKRPWYIRIFYK